MSDIEKLRKEIDKIDTNMIVLIRKRFETARKIGKYKRKNGLRIRDLKREKEVLRKIAEKAKNRGIKDIKEIKNIYKSIMKSSRNLQK